MRTIHEYLDAAQAATPTGTVKELAKMIGVTRAAVYIYRNEGGLPDTTTMLLIASVAGLDPFDAVVDLAIMNCRRENNKRGFDREMKIKNMVVGRQAELFDA